MKTVFCAVIVALAVAAQVAAQDDSQWAPKTWESHEYYDDYYDIIGDGNDNDENLVDKKNDYEKDKELPREQEEPYKEDKYDPLADYLAEDNRSNTDDKDVIKENDDNVLDEELMPDDTLQSSLDRIAIEAAVENYNNEDKDKNNNAKGEILMDEIQDDQEPEKQKSTLEKSQNGNDLLNEEISEQELVDQSDIDPQSKNIVEADYEMEKYENIDENKESIFNINDNDENIDVLSDNDSELANNESISEENNDDANENNLDESIANNNESKENNDSINENEDVLRGNFENNNDIKEIDDGLSENSENKNYVKEKDEDYIRKNSENIFGLNDKSDEKYENNNGLKESDKSLSENIEKDEDLKENDFGNNDDETPDDVLKELNGDLDTLLETLNKLSDNDDGLGDNVENEEIDDVQEYEDKYDRPYKEGNILSLRNELDNFDDSDIFDANSEILEDKSNEKESFEQDIDNDDDDDKFNYSEELEKLFSAFSNSEEGEKIDNIIDDILRHSYGNDGLEDDQLPIDKDAEIISTTEAAADIIELTTSESTNTERRPSTVMVDDLSSSEYNDLMTQFAFAHNEDLNVNSENFVKNVAPIHITLSVDEPTVITSPGYPDYYPTNNIVDWIIEGPGIGIEMNMTHFEVDGALGDYLLVKPGGIDESGTDGLIFSFRLNSERRYRFTNVNRMFVRFEAKPGLPSFKGFSFSARMIWPLPDVGREEVPEPEAVVQPPRETLILSLAGLTVPQFEKVRPAFKELVADMAQEYIKDNDIHPGLNTTLEVTQITRVAICNIRWPNYDTCVEVTFGVPIHYEEEPENPRLNAEDLDAMWRTYFVKDKFASRLRDMGITEYAIPNDRTILMVWLVIALGVVISMAMLAFALWRFSCFEDYTRMRAYNDTDSIQNEKKTLDLYPTPHQTLPPLYTEDDYKWADDKYNDSTRVDMGGFANKSYMRDNLFEFDSDEDIITPRDRKGVISPRDVYEV